MCGLRFVPEGEAFVQEAGNIYWLAEGEDGMDTLNDSLILSPAIDSVTPIEYSFNAASDATVFHLEQVNIDGSSEDNGPFNLGEVYGSYTELYPPDVRPSIYLPFLSNP